MKWTCVEQFAQVVPDLQMQSRYLLNLLDGDSLYFGFVKLFISGTTEYLLFRHDTKEIIVQVVTWN